MSLGQWAFTVVLLGGGLGLTLLFYAAVRPYTQRTRDAVLAASMSAILLAFGTALFLGALVNGLHSILSNG
ncbi:MAG: hypothetical protein ACFB9M_13890 [Myxococcota bacterium]